MRVALVISSLACGGSERVVSMLANAWADAAYDVGLVTVAFEAEDFYPLDNRVTRIALGHSARSPTVLSMARNNLRLVRRLKAAIQRLQPEVVVSFIHQMNVLTLLATRGSGVATVVSERGDPRMYSPGRPTQLLRRLLYPSASRIVTQTESAREWATRFVAPERVRVIPNYVVPPRETGAPFSAANRRPYVVALGRLTPVKGYDQLLTAFAQCTVADWDLVIVGDGPERESLERLVDHLGLSGRVHLPGRVVDPGPILCGASLYVLSSRHEGFPNALIEGMSHGLPAVSFDGSPGPREIIRNEIDGLLVPAENVDALAKAMDRLMTETETRARMAERAREVVERFSMEKVLGRWQALLQELARKSP